MRFLASTYHRVGFGRPLSAESLTTSLAKWGGSARKAALAPVRSFPASDVESEIAVANIKRVEIFIEMVDTMLGRKRKDHHPDDGRSRNF